MKPDEPTLITTREALAILTWVPRSSLYEGRKGTDELTRFPYGLWSKEECEALKQRIIEQGESKKARKTRRRRKISYELT